jgi:hypothetical protein
MENFISLKPSNPRLNEYIESYYFHKSDGINSVSKIIFFPNTKNALTIYKNAEYNFNKNHITVAIVKIIPKKRYRKCFMADMLSSTLKTIRSQKSRYNHPSTINNSRSI